MTRIRDRIISFADLKKKNMTGTRNRIISASRRTDIPAWYTPWFLEGIRQGYVDTRHPFTGKTRRVDVLPDHTHSIVFWSKNFGPFLALEADRILTDMGYSLYFNFTVNSESHRLEPSLPDLEQRLEQVRILADRFDPRTIAWRFDPICFYTIGSGGRQNNLSDFTRIADVMAELGIPKCVTSFYDPYRKVETRIRHQAASGQPPIRFSIPALEDRKRIIGRMAAYLSDRGMALTLCCESETMACIDSLGGPVVRANACIDGKLLKRLYGGNPVTKRDYGQRAQKGCRCTQSVDIGSYRDHPCFHDCLFCYANTGLDVRIRQGKVT